jgi:hypothetical protein
MTKQRRVHIGLGHPSWCIIVEERSESVAAFFIDAIPIWQFGMP